MKQIFRHPNFLKLTLLFAFLTAFLMLGTGLSQAQGPSEWEDNFPIPNQPPAQSAPQFILQSEDNSSPQLSAEALSAAKPDLVITDPTTDVAEEIALLTGGGGRSVIIPAADFVVDSSNRTWFFGFNSSYLYPNTAAGYCGVAPVYLPDGVTITAFVAYMYRNDLYASESFLYAKPLGNTTNAATIGSVSPADQSTSLQVLVDATIGEPSIVNNAMYTYHIGVCLWGINSDQRFYAALVSYLP